MCTFNPFFVFILFSLFPVLFLQQIFENYSTCEYFTDDNNAEDQNKRLEMPNAILEVTGTGRNSQWKVILSPCGDLINAQNKGCSPGATVCIKNLRSSKKSVLNAGSSFRYTVDGNDKPVLQSVGGSRCDDQENFTVVIEFVCEPSKTVKPTIVYKDDCELRIAMMASSCTPLCTYRVDSHLIDLTPLQKSGSFLVQESSIQKSFRLSLCGPAPECDTNISVCEILHDNNVAAISDVASQHITYDHHTNDLTIKGHYGMGKRQRRNFEIKIKCKWDVDGIDNLRYIVPAQQGRNFKFEGESALACIKLPMNCLLRNNILDPYFLYNLTSLNKENIGWRVGNTPFRTNMYINICGPLYLSFPGSNVCNDKHSQVCYKNESNHFMSLGSIAVNFHVEDDIIFGTFVEGSTCAVNQSLKYSTDIEFRCNQIEKGPILQAVSDCQYKIKWETPVVCPKHITSGDNCILSDVTGIVNLNNIFKSTDRTLSTTPTSHLRYNLCGPLSQPCNNTKDASICYFKNGQEHVVGLENKVLTRDNTLLTLNLHGHKCGGQTSYTKVNFHCNHVAPVDGIVSVNVVKNDCLFEMNVETPLACVPISESECKVYDNNFVYDLSPLSRNSSNYIIKDPSLDINYILNVCRSIVNIESTVCLANSGICIYNAKEPNVKYQYLSLGKANERSKPSVENGDVVIRYRHGSNCLNGEAYTTTIRFQCSQQEEGPRFSTKNECSYEFIWHTQHACPKQILSLQRRSTNTTCKYVLPHTKQTIDLTGIRQMFKIAAANHTYTFSICEDNYTHTYETDKGLQNETIISPVKVQSDENGPYLVYPLENACSTEDHADKLYIHLKCNPEQYNEHFNITGISNCIFHVDLITYLACTSKESAINIFGARIFQTRKENEFDHKQLTNKQMLSYTIENRQNSIQHEDFTDSQITYSNNDSKIIKHDKVKYDIPTKTNVSDKATNTTLPVITKRSCLIQNQEENRVLQLKDIKPIQVTSSKGHHYIINTNQSSVCKGYICKNGLDVIATVDICPIIQFNRTYSTIKLMFSSSNYQECNNGRYDSEIWLKCSSTYEVPKIFMESECSVKVMYPSKEACVLLETPKMASSVAEVAVGSSIGLLVIAIASFGGYLVIRRHKPNPCSRSCYQTISEDKENIRVYLKDTKL